MKLAKNHSLFLLTSLTLCFTLFSIIQVSAGTSVSGVISENTTWSLIDSPVTITGNTLVQSGVTLTIEPGVVVRFAGFYSLYVNDGGRLLASGTQENKIIFMDNGTEIVGSWDQIRCKDGGYIHFEYVTIQYADIGVFLEWGLPIQTV